MMVERERAGMPAKEKKGTLTAPEPPAAGGKKISIVLLGLVILVPAMLGVMTAKFVVQPMVPGLSVAGKVRDENTDKLPSHFVEFPEQQVSVVPAHQDERAPVLIYKVTLVCINEETKKLVEANRPWFDAMLQEEHQYKTRQELDDPLMKESILRKARHKANTLLQRLEPAGAPGSGTAHEILDVLHVKYAVYDI